ALNLYGQDMDSGTSPLVSGLAWTVAFEPGDRQFRGRAALEQQRAAGLREKLAGLLLEDRGIMRHGQRVLTPHGEGVITSGGFSPTMDRSIALARVPAAADGACQVEIRSALKAARIVRPPFVRHGRILVS
ncbi:MAG: glycine cleavage system aminomethyltransferase GcvT, partial [Gammaproteobacteria bacterium]|nr:glycine cleavage system aminomethyltransferase GcvT [Gammaproteobacteria bacterium]